MSSEFETVNKIIFLYLSKRKNQFLKFRAVINNEAISLKVMENVFDFHNYYLWFSEHIEKNVNVGKKNNKI